jgi:glycosyltransferase involved in cell wall biosynthesis
MSDRIRTDGKFFAAGESRFAFRGVTYGTFAAREDGALFPERDVVKQDFAQMRDKGFTVVRTYTPPPDDVLDLAADWDLKILAGVHYPDWRYLLGTSRRDRVRVARDAAAQVRAAARGLAGNPAVLGLSIGNEIPADVLRWCGSDTIGRTLGELVDVARDEDPDLLLTYGNFPTTEFLTVDGLDFLTFNVFLEHRDDLRRYLTRLHHQAGDRPVVIGELGLHASDERRQAEVLDWQLETVIERGAAGACVFSWTDDWVVGGNRVEDWSFGLTRTDRTPRAALDVAQSWNSRTVADLAVQWPAISVVICAYNAASTLDECLRHTCALDYPNLEIIVVDDGSTDETARIARRHPRAGLIEIPHAGLSVARNAGFRVASGTLVAYLDADAYPSPEWPYYLALGLDAPTLAGVGGPNVPPASDGAGADLVAHAPGGPVHVLTADDRAEHIPGCNMAFRKDVLADLGGFDPIFTAAGDDVDLCWRVLDSGAEIGFHPAALVWHHRRPSLRAYLRQQRGYGRSEALVQARHPHRYNAAGSARWSGRIYNPVAPAASGRMVYRGRFGTAPFQSAHPRSGHRLDLAHQVGVPLATLALPTAVLGILAPWLALPALVAALCLLILFTGDVWRAPDRGVAFRVRLALHQVLQPLVRGWARARNTRPARRGLPAAHPLPSVLRRMGRGTVLMAQDKARADLVGQLLAGLRGRGLHVIEADDWADHDARVALTPLVRGVLRTSSHPVGYVQARIVPRVRLRAATLLAIASLLALVNVVAGVALGAVVAADVVTGYVRSRRLLGSLA